MNKFAGPFLLVLLCLVAASIGLLLPVLPLKISLTGFGLVALVVLAAAVLLMPNRKVVPYRLIFAVFALAVITRFLWPNFAYLPIPGLPTKNPQRLVWALAIAYWFYSLATNPELRQRLARRCARAPMVWIAMFLLAWRLLSVFFSEYPGVGLLRLMLEFFEYLPILLFALTWVRDVGDVQRVGRFLLIVTASVCALAAVEVLTQKNLFLSVIPVDLNNEEFIQAALESKVRGGVYRAQASFNHPLLLAQFLCVTLPILLFTMRYDSARTVRFVAMAVVLTLPMVLWATQTRTALGVSALVAIIALLMVTIGAIGRPGRGGRSSRTNLLAGIAMMGLLAIGAVIVAFAVQLAVGRTAEEAGSSNARVEMLQRAIKATQEDPLIGLGPGVGGFEAANFTSRGRVTLDSYWLLVLLESGLPAFAALVLLFLLGSMRAASARPSTTDMSYPRQRGMGIERVGLCIDIVGAGHTAQRSPAVSGDWCAGSARRSSTPIIGFPSPQST